MKASVNYRLGGRSVSSKTFFEDLAKQAISSAEDEIERRLRRVRDRDTCQPVKVTRRRVGGKTSWDVEGSPEAMTTARKILEGQG